MSTKSIEQAEAEYQELGYAVFRSPRDWQAWGTGGLRGFCIDHKLPIIIVETRNRYCDVSVDTDIFPSGKYWPVDILDDTPLQELAVAAMHRSGSRSSQLQVVSGGPRLGAYDLEIADGIELARKAAEYLNPTDNGATA